MKRYSLTLTKYLLSRLETITQNLRGLEETDVALVVRATQAEFNDIPHRLGIVSMARATDPNSAGSQLFIVFKWLTVFGQSITVFGRVTEGMNTVDKIVSVLTNEKDQPVDLQKALIKSVRIEEG